MFNFKKKNYLGQYHRPKIYGWSYQKTTVRLLKNIICFHSNLKFLFRFLKKLDGYPVIREVDNDDEEEVSSILDMNEIDRLAK